MEGKITGCPTWCKKPNTRVSRSGEKVRGSATSMGITFLKGFQSKLRKRISIKSTRNPLNPCWLDETLRNCKSERRKKLLNYDIISLKFGETVLRNLIDD